MLVGFRGRFKPRILGLSASQLTCVSPPFVVLQILLIAASRGVSIFAACRDLADAPSDDTVLNALYATLPDIAKLEGQLKRALCTELPKALAKKSRKIAIDLTLISYHGQPAFDEKEVYRRKPKSGTSHFHAYATAVVVHKGYRFTLALTYVQRNEALKDVLKRLIRLVRKQGVKTKYTLLDKEFCSVEVIQYLRRAKHSFVIAAPVHGRKTKNKNQPATGLRRGQPTKKASGALHFNWGLPPLALSISTIRCTINDSGMGRFTLTDQPSAIPSIPFFERRSSFGVTGSS